MGRILGIDHGLKRMGLALSDPLHIIASPFKTLIVSDEEDIFDSLKEIAEVQDIEIIVIGLPKGMKGQETSQTESVRAFADTLEKTLHLPVVFEDERLSSVSAKKSLIHQGIKTGHDKEYVDRTAAAIFLQQYLDKIR